MYSSTSNLEAADSAHEIGALSRRGWRGGIITPHRALVRLHLGPGRIAESVLLAFGATIGWILALPAIGRLWGDIFTFWARHLGMKTEVLMVPQGWGNHIHFSLPCFAVAAGPATGMVWWVTAILTLLCFVGSFFLPEDVLPWMYLLRGFCLLQATALGYLALASARFPHDLPG